ncbi:fimbrial protein [Pseudomonas sp. BN411]|uniref:fimbrial protein n=1 Tax=Pseudomonas sp. BN411 TaxID=2567887 RepID=UPI0024554A19|nr:fimbrial protein [Pseudomonas sp. BN411]MDH4560579.1 type 1 fimbrial protein [Pseudomonas sp. BN411]
MLFKRLSLAVLVAAASHAALASPATSTIQFEGAVKGTTCTVSVGGVDASTPSTVILSDLDPDDISEGAYWWRQGANFSIDLMGCSGSATLVRASFQGANGTTVTDGRLNNMATDSPASNIQLWLRVAYPHSRDIEVGGDQSTLPYASIWAGMAWLGYEVRYTGESAPSAGNIEAAVEYTVAYQ